jgi:hypothetical protein
MRRPHQTSIGALFGYACVFSRRQRQWGKAQEAMRGVSHISQRCAAVLRGRS